MKMAPFRLERYFAEHEFSARYLLSCSDCEPLALSELLGSADEETGRMWNELKLSYTETWGHPLLRETVAGVYEGVGEENVLVAAPEELIFLAMHALLNPGDHAICAFPGYQSLHEVARSIGCDLSFWEAEEHRGWAFDPERLESLVKKDTKLIVVNFPHNPTGFVPSRKTFERIARIAKERDIFLFSDEMYRFLEIDGVQTLPSACELYDNTLSLFGLSKTFGLPGLRIGWLVCRNRDLLERICLLKDYTTICNGAPSEILAIMALRNRERIVEAQRDRLAKNLAELSRFFDGRKGLFSWNRPLGGSISFPKIEFTDDVAGFCEKLVKDTGIMLAPSSLFGYGNKHARIGFGREDFPEVLSRFAEYVDSESV